MAEASERQTPLQQLYGGKAPVGSDATVRLRESAPRGRINLRGDPADRAFLTAVAGVVGIAPPVEHNTAHRGADATILWLGPDEWLVETDAAKEAKTAAALDAALAAQHAAATAVGDAGTTFALAGPRAPDVLAKGMTLDLDPAVFLPGRCARSLLAKAAVLLHRPEEQVAFEITVGRSFTDYSWRWLEDAALEYLPPREQ